MDYQVSAKIQSIFEKTITAPQIARAIEMIRDDHVFSMEEHKAFVLCESPTFCEDERAKLFAQKLTEYGLPDVRFDEYKNVWGIRKGTGNGPVILVEAHMDTVFLFGSVKEIRDENGVMYAPGATDNTRGMTTLLAVLRAMNRAQIRTKGDVIFCGTSREEGMGSLGGMRDFLEHGPICHLLQIDIGMEKFPWHQCHFTHWPQSGYHAFPFGNIDSYCVHYVPPLVWIWLPALLIACSIFWV